MSCESLGWMRKRSPVFFRLRLFADLDGRGGGGDVCRSGGTAGAESAQQRQQRENKSKGPFHVDPSLNAARRAQPMRTVTATRAPAGCTGRTLPVIAVPFIVTERTPFCTLLGFSTVIS